MVVPEPATWRCSAPALGLVGWRAGDGIAPSKLERPTATRRPRPVLVCVSREASLIFALSFRFAAISFPSVSSWLRSPLADKPLEPYLMPTPDRAWYGGSMPEKKPADTTAGKPSRRSRFPASKDRQRRLTKPTGLPVMGGALIDPTRQPWPGMPMGVDITGNPGRTPNANAGWPSSTENIVGSGRPIVASTPRPKKRR
jgi:hypothetical protein